MGHSAWLMYSRSLMHSRILCTIDRIVIRELLPAVYYLIEPEAIIIIPQQDRAAGQDVEVPFLTCPIYVRWNSNPDWTVTSRYAYGPNVAHGIPGQSKHGKYGCRHPGRWIPGQSNQCQTESQQDLRYSPHKNDYLWSYPQLQVVCPNVFIYTSSTYT